MGNDNKLNELKNVWIEKIRIINSEFNTFEGEEWHTDEILFNALDEVPVLLWNDEGFMLDCIGINAKIYRYTPTELKINKKFMIKALEKQFDDKVIWTDLVKTMDKWLENPRY